MPAMAARIAINPGHHPVRDSGAVGPAGLREADVAMAVAKKLAEHLAELGHEIIFISSDELASIAGKANAAAADVFVSVHCNGAAWPKASGTETWAYAGSAESIRLAKVIQSKLAAALGLFDRGVKLSEGLYVLKRTAMPAALAELAFITNPTEEALLADAKVRQRAAKAIAEAVDKWLGG